MDIDLLIRIISVLSIPTGLYAIWRYFYNQVKAVKLGVQALLRASLISDYNKYMELGYAPIYIKENFENVALQYHNLGQNGVMNQMCEDFLKLPTQPPTKKEEGV